MAIVNTGIIGSATPGAAPPGLTIQRIHAIVNNAIPVGFTAAYAPAQAIEIDYSVQTASQNALAIGFWVVRAETGFTINGVRVPAPQHVVYTPRTSVGTDLAGITIVQGSTQVQWQYDVLIDTEIAQLMALFNPKSPQVTITYPNELGFWVQKTAYIQNFNFGQRQTVLHNGVSLTFTGILPD